MPPIIYAPPFIMCALITTIAVAGLLLQVYRQQSAGKWILKPIASTAFLIAALFARALDSSYGQAIFTALVLSWWGDLLLISRQTKMFLAGLIAFLTAHLAFGVAFLIHGINWTWVFGLLPVLIPTAIIVHRSFRDGVPSKLARGVVAYVAVITAMVALAFGAHGTALIPLGATAFWASDISVARDRFTKAGFINRLWGLPLYYLAQFIFICTIGGSQ